MSAWASLLGEVANTAQNIGYKYLDQKLGQQNTSYASNLSKYNSADLTAFASQVGRQDYSWQKKLDYYYDENQYYNLAKRYAENSAQWNVQGLRNAGLNPILAATDGNFASTYGSGSSSSGSAHGSASNVSASPSALGSGSPTSFTDTMRDLASADSSRASAELAQTDNATRKALRTPLVASANSDAYNKTAQGRILDAERAKVDAETDSIKANTAKTLSDIVDLKSGGKVSGFWNMIGRSLSWLNSRGSDDAQKAEAEKAGLKSFFRNSARDGIKESQSENDGLESFLREQSEAFERRLKSQRNHHFIFTR